VGNGTRARGKSSRSVKMAVQPIWFVLGMRNCSPLYAGATGRARATTSAADKRGRKSTFRLTAK
jgi:hypothetical protein